MTETNDDLVVGIPAQGAVDEDVEAHGMREVAAGVTVAAALLGSAGAASALDGPPTAGGSAGTAVQAVDDTLRGSNTETGRALAKNLKPYGDKAVSAAHGADATTGTTVSFARETAGGAQQTVQERTSEAGALIAGVQRDADERKQEALTAAEELAATAGEIGGAALSDVGRLAEAAANAARSIFGWLQQEVESAAAFVTGEVDRTKGDVEAQKQAAEELAAGKVDEAKAEVDKAGAIADEKVDEAKQAAAWALAEARTKAAEAARTLDEAKASAVVTVGTVSRAIAHDVQQAADRGVTAAKEAPATAIDRATTTAEQAKQKWEETTGGITVPDAYPIVDDAVEKAEDALGGISTSGATSGLVGQAPQLP